MQIPVLLLGGINVARAFGLAGIPVVVLSPDPDEPALSSRYCCESEVIAPLEDEASVLAALRRVGTRLARRFGRRIPLVFGNDDFLRFAHAHREALAEHFRVELVDRDLGEALLDKSRFAELARKHALPVPATLSWDGEGRDALAGFPGPVLVKPNVKFRWEDSPLLAGLFRAEAKATIFDSGRAAREHPAVARHHQDLVFQQYIAGDDRQLHCFDGVCDRDSRVLAGYTGRKIRTFPPLVGESSCVELTREPALAALAHDIARRLGLRGIFNMDFKQDPRDGRYYLLEVNARYNFWLYAGAKNGVNLARVMYDWLLHGTVPGPLVNGTRVRWVDMKLDYRAFRSLAASGELGWGRWLASLAPPTIHSVFSWRDPYPWLRSVGRRIERRCGGRARQQKRETRGFPAK
jgi:predicted ATP-grasp superfamily ATP-dependent carboligase